MEEREVLEREMTPPRKPGTYHLGKGVVEIVRLGGKEQPYSGWTDSIINKEEQNRRKKGYEAWCKQ